MQRLLLTLMDQIDGSITVKRLKEIYKNTFNEELDMDEVTEKLDGMLKVNSICR